MVGQTSGWFSDWYMEPPSRHVAHGSTKPFTDVLAGSRSGLAELCRQIAADTAGVKGVVRDRVMVNLGPESVDLQVTLYTVPTEPVVTSIRQVVSARLPDRGWQLAIRVDGVDLRVPGSGPPPVSPE